MIQSTGARQKTSNMQLRAPSVLVTLVGLSCVALLSSLCSSVYVTGASEIGTIQTGAFTSTNTASVSAQNPTSQTTGPTGTSSATITLTRPEHVPTTSETKVPSTTTTTTTTSSSSSSSSSYVFSSARTTQAQQPKGLSTSQQQPASPVTTTTATTTTTQAPKPASQQLAQKQQTQPTTIANIAITPTTTATTASVTSGQFRFVKPVSLTFSTSQLSREKFAAENQQQPEVMCQHNNRTFKVGERWNDDCLHVCECVLSSNPDQANGSASLLIGINACRPRCPVYGDPPGDQCKLVRASTDECCLEWQCQLDAKFAPSSTTSPDPNQPSSTTTTTTTQATTTTGSPTTTTVAPTMASTLTSISTSQTQTRPTTVSRTVTTMTTNTSSQSPKSQSTNVPVILTTTTAAATTTTTTTRPTTMQLALNSVATISTPVAPHQAREARRQHLPSGNTAHSNSLLTGVSSTTRPQRNLSDLLNSRNQEEQVVATQPDSLSSSQPSYIDSREMLSIDLCVASPSWAMLVGTNWTNSACNQTCRCAFRDEPKMLGTDVYSYPTYNNRRPAETEVRCSLPPKCDIRRLLPSVNCPNPQLVVVDDNLCTCPEIKCSLSPQQLQQQHPPQPAASTSVLTSEPVQVCRQSNGKTLAVNETYNDECHSTCRCTPSGEIHCEQLNCQPPSDHLCLEWVPASDNFKPNASQCCPGYVCRKPVSVVSPDRPNTNPPITTTLSLPDGGADDISVSPTSHSALTTTTSDVPSKSCTLLGVDVPHGEPVPGYIQGETSNDQNDEGCPRTCTCQDGSIVCDPNCPVLGDTPPMDLECPGSMAVKLVLECCPKWVCQLTEPYALKKFEASVVNATTVEILISLPDFALNQRGKMALNYTNQPQTSSLTADNSVGDDTPPPGAVWLSKMNIKTQGGQFSKRQITYYWSDLKPGHKYWFKVLVYLEDGPYEYPIESPLQSIVMPTIAKPAKSATSQVSTSQKVQSVTIRPVQAVTQTAPTTTTTTTTTPKPTTTTMIVTTNPPTTAETTTTTTTPTPTTSTTTTSTTTTTTTTTRPPATDSTTTTRLQQIPVIPESGDPDPIIPKEDVSQFGKNLTNNKNNSDYASHNRIEQPQSVNYLPVFGPFLSEQIKIEHYAWHLLVALSVMTALFIIVSYLYCKKSRVIAPITSPHYPHHHAHLSHHHQSAYDNPTFTKLVSYYANQPHVLLVDESNQNFDNLAKQKNMEVDKSSPLHNNTSQAPNLRPITTPVHHNQNGRQNLI